MSSYRRFALRVATVVLLSGICFGQTLPVTITGLNPSTVAAGSGAFLLSIQGTGFQIGAQIRWNSTILPASSVTATLIQVAVPASLVVSPGTAFVVVTNPTGTSAATTFTITAQPVSITTTSLPAGRVGTPYSASLAATGGIPPYSWTAVSGVPGGLTFSTNGTLSGTPTLSGNFTLSVRVSDAQGGSASQSLAVTIAGLAIVTQSPLPAGTAGQKYSVTFSSAGGTPPYSWSGQNLPVGLSIDAPSGVLSGTPPAAGTFTFQVQVRDAANPPQVASQNFTLTVNPAPLSIATLPPLFQGTVGTPYTQTFTATGGVQPYSWSLVNGSVPGLTFSTSANQGVLSGTPTATGNFTFTVQVTDSAGGRASGPFTVTVTVPALSIVNGATLPSGTVGVSYSQQFTAVGGTPPYTWSLVSGSIPTGLDFNASQATLSGTPQAPGTFNFTLQVRDSGSASATRAFTATISPATLIITSATQLPGATLGAAYFFQMTATGGVAPYSWNAVGLPDGLAIDANTGTITGTMQSASPVAFVVRVTDSVRSFAQNTFQINVSLPAVPAATISGLPPTVGAAQQYNLKVSIGAAYPTVLTGQAIITFSPDAGSGDGTIQFSTGGTTADFTIPAGNTDAVFSRPLALQTGTVAGTITISLRLNAGGLDVTPSPAPAVSTHLDAAAPVITSVSLTRSGGGLSIRITGYSTTREVTQAVFAFSAASGQTLQQGASQITVPVDTLFRTWYQDPANSAYGSQFVLTQPFTVQGDANAVNPQSVTLTNRIGSVSAPVQP